MSVLIPGEAIRSRNEKDADPGGEISVPSFAAMAPRGEMGRFREGRRKGRLTLI